MINILYKYSIFLTYLYLLYLYLIYFYLFFTYICINIQFKNKKARIDTYLIIIVCEIQITKKELFYR